MICPICNEDYMGCDRYGCWKTFSKDRAKVMSFDHGGETVWPASDQLDRGIIPNSQNKPEYSLLVTYLIGALILVCMGTGIWMGVNFGY